MARTAKPFRIALAFAALMALIAVAASGGLLMAQSPDNNPATGAPRIEGAAQLGEELSACALACISDADGLTNASYGGIWWAGNHFRAQVDPGEDLSYRVSRGDLGLPLRVTVDFTDDAGKRATLDSAPTAAVAPASPAAPELLAVSRDISGDPELAWEDPLWDLGGELDGRPAWGDGGAPITGYVVQWKEAADSWDTAADVSEATVTRRRYTIGTLTSGKEYAIRVLAVNSAGRGIPAGEVTFAMGPSSASSNATLSALTLSCVDFGPFASETISYTAGVANNVSRTKVKPTVTHLRASYAVKLGGVADADGVIELSVGSNIITIEVTAEDGQTTRTYTVTVTRDAPSSGVGTPLLTTVQKTLEPWLARSPRAATGPIAASPASPAGATPVTTRSPWLRTPG